jgi:hypothetical protein
LELLPLLGCQDLLQTFVSLLSNLEYSWLGLYSKRSQLISGIVEDLLHLCLLIVAEIQSPLETIKISRAT